MTLLAEEEGGPVVATQIWVHRELLPGGLREELAWISAEPSPTPPRQVLHGCPHWPPRPGSPGLSGAVFAWGMRSGGFKLPGRL